jgi:hypothetical protein
MSTRLRSTRLVTQVFAGHVQRVLFFANVQNFNIFSGQVDRLAESTSTRIRIDLGRLGKNGVNSLPTRNAVLSIMLLNSKVL